MKKVHSSQLDLFKLPDPVVSVPVSSSGIAPLFQPVSDETGGPLNGNEAVRVMTRQSIRFAGKMSVHGVVACREHAEAAMQTLPGYWMTVYSGTTKDVACGRCSTCGVDVVGELPR